MTYSIRPVTQRDAAAWLRLRHALWPESSESELRAEIDEFFAGWALEPIAVLLAEEEAGAAVGMAELSIRSIVEGCSSGRVAYLEGWYVVPEARRRGVGRALVAAAEVWGREQGCTEFGSDTQLDNLDSGAAHRALGFTEVEQIRCFRKAL
jgi:aminoglycoside 6'-N-acetyltransferase I